MPKPDFLIVGGAKCGTSALWKILSQHSQLSESPFKEMNFFNKPNLTEEMFEDYCDQFTPKEGQLCFEASPSYTTETACGNIARFLPDAKIVLIIRNPVEVTLSKYLHFHTLEKLLRGQDSVALTWRKANPMFVKRALGEVKFRGPKGKLLHECQRNGFALYPNFPWIVTNYWQAFGKEQVRIIEHQDLLNNFRDEINKLQTFLGVTVEPLQNQVHNVTSDWAEMYPTTFIDECDVEWLLQRHMAQHEAMEELLQRELPWGEPNPVTFEKPLPIRKPTKPNNRPTDCIIPGAPKCGTTALFAQLMWHPDISGPWIKESNFFNLEAVNPESVNSYFETLGPGAVRIEASTRYPESKETLEKIVEHCPDVQFIYMIRNPTIRAIHAYKHFRVIQMLAYGETEANIAWRIRNPYRVINFQGIHWPKITQPFTEALHNPAGYFERDLLRAGEYITRIKWMEELVGSDRVHVMRQFDLRHRRKWFLSKVFGILGVPAIDLPESINNTTSEWLRLATPEPCTEEDTQFCIEHFKPFNAELEEHLGRKLNWDNVKDL